MEIGPESNAKIQVGDGELQVVLHAVIERDMLQSRLVGLVGVDGSPIVLPVGERVTLFQGPAVVFVGQVQEDLSVIDLLSAESGEAEEFEDF